MSRAWGLAGLLGCAAVVVLGTGGTAAAAPVTTTTTVTLAASTTHPYQPVTVTATVVAGDASTVSGTVSFSRGGTAACTAVPVSAGAATCAVAPTVAGSAPVTATYSPATPAAGSDGAAASSGTSPALAVSVWPVSIGDTSSDTATASCSRRTVTVAIARVASGTAPIAGLPVPGGTVTVGSTTVTLPAGGTATVCVARTSTTTIAYSGDARYAAARVTESSGSGTVTPGHTRTGVTPVGAAPAPGHTRTGAEPNPPIAATGPAHLEGLLTTAGGLLLAGLALLRLGRRRPVLSSG